MGKVPMVIMCKLNRSDTDLLMLNRSDSDQLILGGVARVLRVTSLEQEPDDYAYTVPPLGVRR